MQRDIQADHDRDPPSIAAVRTVLPEAKLTKLAVITDRADEKAKAGTVGSAMAILRLLADSERPMGVNAIARELSLAPSSCFKILKALLADDFVEIDEGTKGYSLGSGAILVARRALDPSRVFGLIRSRLEETAQAYSIAIGLWRMLPRDRMVLSGFAEGSNQMRIHMPVGQRLPILVGAVGRAVAAHLDLSTEDLQKGFEELRWQGPLSFEEYVEQVERAKRLGYGFDKGNFAPGVNTVAVVIVDHAGIVRYGLSGIMFNGQHDSKVTEKIAKELIELARWCSVRLVSQPLRPSDA
jgi:DNA-binding IclR family transcriptional regulator